MRNLCVRFFKLLVAIVVVPSLFYLITIITPPGDIPSSVNQVDCTLKHNNIRDQETLSPIVQTSNPQGNISTPQEDQIIEISSNNGILFTIQIDVMYGSLIISDQVVKTINVQLNVLLTQVTS